MGGSNKNKNVTQGNAKSFSRSGSQSSESVVSEDRTMSNSPQEITMADYIEITNRRFDDLHLRLVTKQEQRIAEIRAEFNSAFSVMRNEVTELRRSLEFTQSELASIKETRWPHHAADDTVTADRIENVEKTLEEITKHVDYLDN